MGQAKLVRDRIPDIIRERGDHPVTRKAADDEYPDLLRDKLREEVQEFLESNNPEELADVLEVLFALAESMGVDRDQLEDLRTAKVSARGAFADRIVWSGNQSTADDGAYGPAFVSRA